MICAIMQPTYIPWLGYFNMISKSDTFVFLDNVQIKKRSWQVRNRIKGVSGELMLTIPTSSGNSSLICETKIDDTQKWRDKHLKAFQMNYSKALFFKDVFSVLCDLYSAEQDTLSEFNISFIKEICGLIGVERRIIKSSDLNAKGQKDELLVNICKEMGADIYLSARGSSEYINRYNQGGVFPENNIELFYFDYNHPVYPQLHGDFVPFMGVLDLLFNVGFEGALEIVTSGDMPMIPYEEF